MHQLNWSISNIKIASGTERRSLHSKNVYLETFILTGVLNKKPICEVITYFHRKSNLRENICAILKFDNTRTLS